MAQAPTSQMVCEIRSPLLAKHLARNCQRLDHRGASISISAFRPPAIMLANRRRKSTSFWVLSEGAKKRRGAFERLFA